MAHEASETTRSSAGAGQWAHAALLALLLGASVLAAKALPIEAGEGWLAAGIATAVAHQTWVVVWWRLEYYRGIPSARLGRHAFRIYAAGFGLLGVTRIACVVAAALADAGSWPIPPALGWTLGALLLLPPLWLLHSIIFHFGFDHAVGADHFFEEHRTRGLCREGIFRYLSNAMYWAGFLVLWAPAFAWASKTALLLAAFNHAYIWVHYFCTERPDMRRIYG